MKLSSRIQKIKPSATLAINAKAIELKKQGRDILKFGTGEPDFDTPQHIKDAAKKALDEGFTKYTAATGIIELKEAVCKKFKSENGINYKPSQVIITNGGKQALFNFFMAVINEGDEVIIPSPFWLSYEDMIAVCDGKTVFVDTRTNNFKLTAKMVEPAISKKTKVLILNSPNNPTGMIVEEREIRKIAELAKQHNFYVISDEVYENFCYDGKKNFSIGSIPGMEDFVFTTNAVSKTYAMTGWRIGYIGGPEEIIRKMGYLQGHSTSNPCSIAQKAALAALTGPRDPAIAMAKEFARKRDYVFEEVNKISGLSLVKPEGAFYTFIKVSDLYTDKMNDSFKFSDFLLDKADIVVVPGGSFGKEGDEYIRFSYASSMEDIEKGIKRMKKALE